MLDPAHENGPLLVVITGPSAAGKDSVIDGLEELGFDFLRVVTVTTRQPREGEEHGVHYHFVARDEYDVMVKGKQLLEYAEVYGNGYGTPSAPVREALAAGRDVVLRVDVQGAASIGELVPGAIRIFLAPSGDEEQVRQLTGRGTESPEEFARRLGFAAAEMEQASKFEYLVVNRHGHLEETVKTVAAIMKAERARIHRQRVVVQPPDRASVP